MKNYSTVIEGKKIIYQDTVIVTITTRFTFWQRIKILFGCKVVSTAQVFLRTPAQAVGQQVQTTVIRLPKKQISNDSTRKN